MSSEFNVLVKSMAQHLSDEEFAEICIANRDLRFERDSNSNIIIMSPVKDESSELNCEVSAQLHLWNKKNKMGKVFDSRAGFTLSNTAVRSPDATWIELNNYKSAKIAHGEEKGFLKITPDFVIEVKSESDVLETLKAKMEEYLACGVKLAYLINADDKTISIYRPGKSVEHKLFSERVIATEVVVGFELDLSSFVNPSF